MAGRLPLAGLEAIFYKITTFLKDITRYSKGVKTVRTETETTAKSVTGSMEKMAAGMQKAAKSLDVEQFEQVRQGVEALGGKLEDLGGGMARLSVPMGVASGEARLFTGALETAGYQVEVVEQKVEGATGAFEMFRKSMLAMGTLRGGMAFRFMKGMGGTVATMAVVGYVAVRAAKAIGRAAEKFVEALEGLERADIATSSLEKLGRQAGVTAEAIVTGAVIASRYTLEGAKVTVRFNELMMTSHQQLAAAIPELAEAAFITARALGKETEDVLDDWIEAIKKGDAAALEAEYGFRGVEDAVDDFARSLGLTEDDLSDYIKEFITLQAILGQTEDYMGRLGTAEDTAAESARKHRQALGEMFPTMREFGLLEAKIAELYAEIQDSGTEAAQARADAIREEQKDLYDLRGEYAALLEVLEGAPISPFEIEKWRKFGIAGRMAMEEQRLAELKLDAIKERAAERDEERVLKVLDARQGYREQLEADLISLTAYGMSSEKILGLITQKTESLDALMLKLGDDILTPAGKVALVEYWESITSIGEAAQEAAAQQGQITEAVRDFVVEALQMGMPYEEALRYGEAMRVQLGELGDLSSEEAQAAANAILAIFTNLLEGMAEKTESFIKGLVERADAEFDKLGERVARKAITIAPYVTFEKYQEFAEGYNAALKIWYDKYYPNLWGPKAQWELGNINSTWESIVSNITRAGKGIGTSVSAMKRLADETLLASKALGAWATAYKVEHKGVGVLAAYARHEEPLVAAMVDKLFAERTMREKGRPPTREEDVAHWYEVHYPLEIAHVPGAPMRAGTGPIWEEARRIVAETGFEGLGDIYAEDYKARKGLVTELDKETLAREGLVEALDDMTAAVRAAEAAFTPPLPLDDEAAKEVAKEIAKEFGAGWSGAIPEFQRGGLTRGAGLAWLHAGELVIPLNRLIDTVNMRMGGPGGDGGLSIQNLSIPVTVGAGTSATVARDVQSAVVHAIRGRAGTEMRRAARRMGR